MVLVKVSEFVGALQRSIEIIRKRLEKREYWFRNLWENNADLYEFYKLAKAICKDIEFEEFYEAWQFRTVLHEDYEQAKVEFINLLAGWW